MRSLPDPPDREMVRQIMQEVIDVEKAVCDEIMEQDDDDPAVGISASALYSHILYMANRTFGSLYPDEPFPFGKIEIHPIAEKWGVKTTTNNFEQKNIEYGRDTGTVSKEDIAFNPTDDF